MVENYIKNIKDLLDKIEEENTENINQIIDIETSSMYCIGNKLYMYGKLYKIVWYAENYDDVIQKLQKDLIYNGDYELIYDEVKEIQKRFIEDLKNKKNYENTKWSVLDDIEHNYIFDTMLKSC